MRLTKIDNYLLALILFFATACATTPPTAPSGWVSYDTPDAMGYLASQHCQTEGSRIHVVGGIREGEPNAMNTRGFSFDLKSKTWTAWSEDSQPSPRQNFITALSASSLLLFGGEIPGDSRVYRNEAFLYDLDQNRWISLGEAPLIDARAHASATTIGSEVFIFGGRGEHQNLNIGVFDADTRSWSVRPAPHELGTRQSHVAVGGDDYWMIWGGFKDGKRQNDGFLFDTKRRVWLTLPREDWLEGRANARGVAIGRKVYILGGTGDDGSHTDGALFDLDSMRWLPLPPLPDPALDQLRHFELKALSNQDLILWGGRIGTGAFSNRSFVFETSKYRWREVSISPSPEALMAGCLGVTRDGAVFQIGGIGQNAKGELNQFDRLWLLDRTLLESSNP